jgi:hypothetical protein
MRRVQVQDITEPNHLTVFPYRELGSDERVRMDVYTGWIRVNFYGGGGPVHTEDYVSFLPIGPNTVLDYPAGTSLLDHTVTVSPSSFSDDDDEGNLVAVDEAFVTLETQSQIVGDPNCLVLHPRVTVNYANLIAITYQVTVLTAVRDDVPDPRHLGHTQTPRQEA